jgi:hypothetical protein
MPFCPCYFGVDLRSSPGLCCLCVGRSSPGQPSRLRPGPACPPAARRPAAVGHPNGQPFIQLPLRQAGNDASRRMESAPMDQTTHNTEYELVGRRGVFNTSGAQNIQFGALPTRGLRVRLIRLRGGNLAAQASPTIGGLGDRKDAYQCLAAGFGWPNQRYPARCWCHLSSLR